MRAEAGRIVAETRARRKTQLAQLKRALARRTLVNPLCSVAAFRRVGIGRGAAAATLKLDWRTGDVAVGTEYAAIAGFRSRDRAASGAVVPDLA